MHLQISILCPGMPFNGNSLTEHSLGGSETAALYMARELADLGNKVTLFNNCIEPGDYDGVYYQPIANFQNFTSFVPHDVTIVQRMPQAFTQRLNSKLNILWQHDLALRRHASSFNGVLWNVDKVAVVSQWMANQYSEVYGEACKNALWVTRNGIDIQLFVNKLSRGERVPGKLIYTARPERGLDVLLGKVFPLILKERPDATLYLAGYDNQVEYLRDFYADIEKAIDSFGDRIIWLGHLAKEQLYEHYSTAEVYVYPTPSQANPEFREVSCITAMECMAAGLPLVGVDRGALSETLGAAGTSLVAEGDFDGIATETLRLLNDPKAWIALSQIGIKESEKYDWKPLAANWQEYFEQQIYGLNESSIRLAHHFIFNSDIIAAKYLLERNESKQAVALKKRLDSEWGFMKTPETYKTQYNKIGDTHTDIFDDAGKEVRLQAVIQWLADKPELQNILDVGCGLGVYAINLSNQLPDRIIMGVDIDESTINWAHHYRKTKAENPDNVKFTTGKINSITATYDCAMAQEILEHVIDPVCFLNQLEARVKVGGKIYLTVPYGPWEQMSYESYPYRCHLWHYDTHDLRDLLKHKKDFNVKSLVAGVNHFSKDPVGWFIITYTADHQPVGRIDMERKISFQRPRQTVTGLVMAGPESEETLLWSLKSYRHVVNELIIADCGMTDTAKQMARRFNAIIVESESPLEVGFETPRNKALELATCDWVLWIDTDEKLVDVPNLFKYLRENVYNGYGIRQHHFAVDTEFSPDMPVRLFRNRLVNGQKMQFRGLLHEHPELELNKGPGSVIVLSDVSIAHVGYLTETVRRNRFTRNHPLLLKDQERYPDRLLQKHFTMRDEMLLAGYELQQNGSVLTDAIKKRCEKVIELYRTYFQNKKGYVNVDSLQYYSQALRILGVGFDMHIDLKAGKDGYGQVNGEGIRFASRDDLMLELERRVDEATQDYINPWW